MYHQYHIFPIHITYLSYLQYIPYIYPTHHIFTIHFPYIPYIYHIYHIYHIFTTYFPYILYIYHIYHIFTTHTTYLPYLPHISHIYYIFTIFTLYLPYISHIYYIFTIYTIHLPYLPSMHQNWKCSTYPSCKCCSILRSVNQSIWCCIARTSSTNHSHIHWQIFQNGHHLDVIHAQQTMPIHLCNSNINLSHCNCTICMLQMLSLVTVWPRNPQADSNIKGSGKVHCGCGSGRRRNCSVFCRVKREKQTRCNYMVFIIKLLSQHVLGIIMPVIRRTRVCTAACSVLHWLWWPWLCGAGNSNFHSAHSSCPSSTQPDITTSAEHHMRQCTLVLLMMGIMMPETCWDRKAKQSRYRPVVA